MKNSLIDVDPDVAALVADAADDFRARQARGEAPDPSEYVAWHPAAGTLIARVLGTLRLAPTPTRAAVPDAPVPAVLGDYRIIREVGRGGMGIVYEAEQVSLGRRVALKVLPFAALSDSRLIQRFKNEALAAAALDHPHVVKVHAVGQDRGTHFLAMQFIDGRPLADFIRERNAAAGRARPAPDAPTVTQAAADSVPDTAPIARASTTRTRGDGAYFRQVATWGVQAAEALEHAHALGVVHRDVKPANLLLDASANVWVADFGLAKLASSDAGVTATGDVLGTLRYMSPEQAGAKHGLVDHRTDVYALGATLYELLTGVPAVDGRDKAEILRKIAFDDPAPPRTLDRSIPADLETVVLKCLAKEPGERYAVARELADDLRRFLANEPVRAKRPTLVARAGKWTRRHRPAVLAALTVALAAVVVGTGLVWRQSVRTRTAYEAEAAQRREAEANWELAEQTVEDMYGQVASRWLKGKANLEPLQREFLEKVVAFYERFAQQRGDRPAVRESVGRAHLRVGQLLARLERPPDAEAALDRASQVFSALAAEFPAVPSHRAQLAECRRFQGDLLTTAYRFPEAELSLVEAIALRTVLADEVPNDLVNRRELANCYTSLGLTTEQADKPEEAEAAYRRAVALLEPEARTGADDAEFKLASARSNLGVRLQKKSEIAEAEDQYRKAVAALEGLVRRQPADPELRSNLALTYGLLASLLREAGRPPAEEEQLHRQAVANQEELVQAHPAVSGYRRELAQSVNNFGVFLAARGDQEGAVKAYGRAVDLHEKLVAEAPAILQHQEGLGSYLLNLGRAHRRLKRYAEAEKAFERARTVLTPLAKQHPTQDVRLALIRCRLDVGALHMEMGKPVEAEDVLRQAAADYDALTAAAPNRADLRRAQAAVQINLARLLAARGESAQAADQYRAALRHWPEAAEAANNLADLLLTRPDPPARDVQEALELTRRAVASAPMNGNFRNTLGVALYRSGDAAAAVRELGESVRLRKGGDSHDFFVLALAQAKVGDMATARSWFDRGVAWMDTNGATDPYLKRLRAETAHVLAVDSTDGAPRESAPRPRAIMPR